MIDEKKEDVVLSAFDIWESIEYEDKDNEAHKKQYIHVSILNKMLLDLEERLFDDPTSNYVYNLSKEDYRIFRDRYNILEASEDE